jgi:hypothetical protein
VALAAVAQGDLPQVVVLPQAVKVVLAALVRAQVWVGIITEALAVAVQER